MTDPPPERLGLWRAQPKQSAIVGPFQCPVQPPSQNRFFQQPLFNARQHDRSHQHLTTELLAPRPAGRGEAGSRFGSLLLVLEAPKALLERSDPGGEFRGHGRDSIGDERIASIGGTETRRHCPNRCVLGRKSAYRDLVAERAQEVRSDPGR